MSDLPKIDFNESRMGDWPDGEEETSTVWEHLCYWITWFLVILTCLITAGVIAGAGGYILNRWF